MDKKTKVLICSTAAYMFLSMVAMIIESRKRKRRASRVGITYGPIEERDSIRLEYLNTKIWRDDTTCVKESKQATNLCDTTSASKAKKAKTSVDEEEGLIGAINRVGDKLACAIEKVATQPPPNDDLPEDLFDIVNSLPGFDSTDISIYYAYLVANPRMGRAFYKLPFEHKLNWFAMFVANKFPGQ